MLKMLNRFVNFTELKFEIRIKEWTVIVSMIVIAVAIYMTSGSCDSCLVSVDGIATGEMDNFVGNLIKHLLFKLFTLYLSI